MCWQHYVFPGYWRDRLGTWRDRSGTWGAEKEFPSFLAGKLSCAYSGLVEVASPVLNTHKWVYLPLVPTSPHHEEVRRGFRGPLQFLRINYDIYKTWLRRWEDVSAPDHVTLSWVKWTWFSTPIGWNSGYSVWTTSRDLQLGHVTFALRFDWLADALCDC